MCIRDRSSAGVPSIHEPPRSSLQAKIGMAMEQRMRDKALLSEQAHLQTPYVFQERADFLAMEDRRRQAERERNMMAPAVGLRTVRDEYIAKSKNESIQTPDSMLARALRSQ
eukprot:TRINITY_DN7714_c0_g1_i2.p2 TRINITY_DN7714_c0_g1~~TRINITY_DN7714_c0_g1_i2.p2  ORF type:complete len:112 (+),score=38.63 TRINITY_DN7714_c0_g1_i2:169-504(+)